MNLFNLDSLTELADHELTTVSGGKSLPDSIADGIHAIIDIFDRLSTW